MIPPTYQPASVRCATSRCPKTGDIAIGLGLPDGTVARYRLATSDAVFLQQSLALYLGRPYACQPSNASDSLSHVGSPHDGQNVSPLERSCAAPAGDAVLPESNRQTTPDILAALVARWMELAGSHITFPIDLADVVAMSDTSKAGLLAGALELRSLLSKLPQGRKALGNLGFEPVLEHIEGE